MKAGVQNGFLPRSRFLVRTGEIVCWTMFLVCMLYLIHVNRAVNAATHAAAAVSIRAPVLQPLADGAVMGRLQIPVLHLSVPVIEGDSKASLLEGVGHIRGTAMPGGLGTVGLAGHRDTFLRKIAAIEPRMSIDLSRGNDRYKYIVDSTEIVHPEDVQVLETENTPALVVVTCYPFHYIGAAPLRFIVKAHLVSVTPEIAR